MRKYTTLILITSGAELCHHQIITGNDDQQVRTYTEKALHDLFRVYVLPELIEEERGVMEEYIKYQCYDIEVLWKEHAMEVGIDCAVIREEDTNVRDVG